LETAIADGSGPAGGAAEARDNRWIAARLDEVAELLEVQQANPFRVRAYRRASALLRERTEPIARVVEAGGIPALRALEGIGESLAHSIEELLRTGRLGLLERLRNEAGPEDVLASVAGIGPGLAQRIHQDLAIDSLYALEAAAHDGRLERVRGMGPRRLRAVRECLAGRFQRPALAPVGSARAPPVGELLEVDREYRERAAVMSLPRIAPRRFNPGRKVWLPVLHTEREGRHYTALFSNTARAHALRATQDWVVIYRDDHEGQGQWTVVTARRGPMAGQRVVRGREEECLAFRAGKEPAGPF